MPGATAARELIVGRALEYLGKLSREAAGDRALQLELAEAYLKIGDVQGKPYTANLGDAAGAARSYATAAEIVAPLAAHESGPAKTQARSSAARAYVALAAVQARLSQFDDAVRNNERALAIGERLLADDPSRPDEWRRLVASCHLGIGDAIQAGNHQRRDPELHRASLDHYQRALGLAEQVVAAQPDSLPDWRQLAKACSRAAIIAELGLHTGEAKFFEQAIALHARSVALRRAVLARDPANAQDRRTLADALIMKSSAHSMAARDLSTALAECEEAVAMQSELAATDPANAEAQQDLSYGHYTTGQVCQLLGDLERAATHYRHSLDILGPLIAARPNNVETTFDRERAQQRLKEIEAAQRNAPAEP